MFVKLWIIFLKGRKQKNMIWNHLEKKQGGKTYSTHPFFFGSLDGCQCFEDHFTWATWWSSSTREHFHHQPSRPVECLLVSSSARTLNGGAFACKGVPNHRDFYQTVNGETFQKNGAWETSMGFNIYIYTLSYDCFDLWHRYLLIVCHLWIENQRFSFNEYNVCVLVLVSDFPSVTHRKSNNFAGDAIKRADKFTQSPKT